jgi:hypothetical protein
MELKSLIGKEILDILVKTERYKEFNYHGLWKAECYYILTSNLTIGLPFHISDRDVWIRTPDPLAKTCFPAKKWWQKTREPDKIKNAVIKDIIDYPEEIHPAYLELDNGIIITEESVAHTGLIVGLYVFNSIHDLEAKNGNNYIRLSNYKGNI